MYIYIYIPSLLSLPSQLPFHPEHQAGLPVLYSSFSLVIYFTHDTVYMSVVLYQLINPLLPPLCPPDHSLCLCFHFFSVNRFICTIH